MSVTYRLFKLPETSSEDATVTYNGGIEGFEEEFNFDHGIVFKVYRIFFYFIFILFLRKIYYRMHVKMS